MLSTIKILQAKNASTGTISMSKRLMAIQETFSSNLGANSQALVLRNGDINKNQKCETVSSTAGTSSAVTSVSSVNGKTDTRTIGPSTAPKPCKPNSLILVPNQTLQQMSNGQVRMVTQPRVSAPATTKERTNILQRFFLFWTPFYQQKSFKSIIWKCLQEFW